MRVHFQLPLLETACQRPHGARSRDAKPPVAKRTRVSIERFPAAGEKLHGSQFCSGKQARPTRFEQKLLSSNAVCIRGLSLQNGQSPYGPKADSQLLVGAADREALPDPEEVD